MDEHSQPPLINGFSCYSALVKDLALEVPGEGTILKDKYEVGVGGSQAKPRTSSIYRLRWIVNRQMARQWNIAEDEPLPLGFPLKPVDKLRRFLLGKLAGKPAVGSLGMLV